MGRALDFDGGDAVPEGLWRARLYRATHSKRAVTRLKEIAAILDAMPRKRLITEALVKDGDCCFVGAVCKAKNVTMPEGDCDIYDTAYKGEEAGLPWTLAWEMASKNDEAWSNMSPEDRWLAARTWVEELLAEAA